jgi:glycosyltransferase involved in cell wall biosynthesis
MQKTNFRFEAIVHDDASTDGTADIIREYAEKYPEIIKPIYEKENQYSKGVGSIRRITNFVIRGKYVALCEGDDYWINPNKLQMQVDFLEQHLDYTMVFTNTIDLHRNGRTVLQNRYPKDSDAPTSDVIIKNGDFIATASICCRGDIYMHQPREVRSQFVGDYPLQIYMAYKGKVRYFSSVTTVYRRNAVGSWTEKNLYGAMSLEKCKEKLKKELKLISDMDKVTEFRFSRYFEMSRCGFLWWYYQRIGDIKNERKYFFKVKHPIQGYSFKAYAYLLLKYLYLLK